MPPFNLMVDICLQSLMFMCRTVTYSTCDSNTISEGHKLIHVKNKKTEPKFGTSYKITNILIAMDYNDASLYEYLKISNDFYTGPRKRLNS